METCSGAHHWARRLRTMGLEPRLIAGHFVTPYRMQGRRGKSDANDAAAVCEAAARPHMRFVPIKTAEQQGILAVHRLREGYEERTLLIQGATSAVMTAHRRRDRISQWLVQLTARVGWHKAVVALANKNARILWAVLAKGRRFEPDHACVKPAPAMAA